MLGRGVKCEISKVYIIKSTYYLVIIMQLILTLIYNSMIYYSYSYNF